MHYNKCMSTDVFTLKTANETLPLLVSNVLFFDIDGVLLDQLIVEQYQLDIELVDELYVPTFSYTVRENDSAVVYSTDLLRFDCELVSTNWNLYLYYDPDKEINNLVFRHKKSVQLPIKTLQLVIGLVDSELVLSVTVD